MGLKRKFLVQVLLFMKQITNDWLILAEDDLIAARTLEKEERLSNLVSFHCQQYLEKCFKAII